VNAEHGVMSIAHELRAAWRGGRNLLFPPVCVHCRGLVPDDGGVEPSFRHLCPECVAAIDFVLGPACSCCGHPFHGVVEGERTCPHCLGLAPAFGRGRTATLFKGPMRSLVLELKYHHGTYLAADLVELFRRATPVVELARGAVLVPVPLHPRKERERGYNQSRLLARALAAAIGPSVEVEELIQRRLDTPSQTAFDRRTRLANLKNAFALAPRVNLNPVRRFVLIDDVFTTGSTLNHCARVLRARGCVNVDVLTLAHG
jgi:ComF family protein